MHDGVQVSEPAGLPTGGEYDGEAAFVEFLQKVAYVELYTVVDGRITAINVLPKDTRALYELVQVPT